MIKVNSHYVYFSERSPDLWNLKNLIAHGDEVEVYEYEGKAVKVFLNPEKKEKCLYEALTQARVETTLVNSWLKMPKVQEVSVLPDGRWAITMDLIKGKTMYELMKEDPSKVDLYIDKMVEIQMELHSQYMPLLSKLKDKMARQIKSLGVIDEIKKYELLTRLDSMPKHIKLCHGNFSPKNIIINDEGTYVLDWVAARQGKRFCWTLQEHIFSFALNILKLLKSIWINSVWQAELQRDMFRLGFL